ncbi:hypothetical protein E4K65_36555 [Bradyrhizobium niftali]|uniref:Uncharacterized protein n=1 Tax=Bradyrhizobium niftali TaxID=2560055 RepID=A0A4Y9LG78_9BRAD|nr:hypothetical protein E4K65_36555 [Bradyrhizobium niftali]
MAAFATASNELKYLTPMAYAAHLTATDDRLRNRRSYVAPSPSHFRWPRRSTFARKPARAFPMSLVSTPW